MSFFRTSTISYPIFGLFAFVFLARIASDGKTVGLVTGYTPAWNDTWTDRLKRDLLLKYDKFARPAQHFNTTTVQFDINIKDITVDDFRSSMVVQAWVKMKWQDAKLKWNISKYGGLDELNVGNHEVWQPDVLLYNSIAGASIEHYGDTHCKIYPNGNVLWVPPTQFHAICDLDLRFWPFDTQHCYLQLGSWMYHIGEIDLQFMKYDGDHVWTKQYSQWDIVSMTRNRTRIKHDPRGYVSIFYNIAIKRHSPIYYATVVTPAVTIVFLTLVIFWLPPQSTEKVTLCGCTALIISIFLIYLGHKVPPLSGKPPLLICFYSGCLHLVTISLIISVSVINLSRRPHCRPLPRRIKKLLFGRFGQYLGLVDHIEVIGSQKPTGEQELRENQSSDGNTYRQSNLLFSNSSENGERESIIIPTTSTAQLEWILASTAIDRLAFFLFSTIFAIMAMICLA